MYKNPLQAYQEVGKSGMSGRDVEAYALTKAAVALRECQDSWNKPERDQRLEHALKLNQRVWSIFQAELTRADNPMPLLIKQNILSLGAFIDKRALKVIVAPEREGLDIIIAINENLAAGLRQLVNDDTAMKDDNESNSLRMQPPHISAV